MKEPHGDKPKPSDSEEDLKALAAQAQARLKAAVGLMKEEKAAKWREVPDSELPTKLAIMYWVLHSYESKYGEGKAPMAPWRMTTMQNDRDDIAACELEIKIRAKRTQEARLRAWAKCLDWDLRRRLAAARRELQRLMDDFGMARDAAEMLKIERTPLKRRTPEQVEKYRKFIGNDVLATWKAETAKAKAEVEAGEAEAKTRGVDL